MVAWFWFFILYSFLGWVVERIFAILTHSPQQQRRCLLFLPLCPVYGLGMCALLALPDFFLRGMWLFFSGAVVTTAVEYAYHWVCDVFLDVRFWDYTGVPGNLHGRVCIPFSLAWGILTSIAARLLQPSIAALASLVLPEATLLWMLVFTADAVCSIRFLSLTHDPAALRQALG